MRDLTRVPPEYIGDLDNEHSYQEVLSLFVGDEKNLNRISYLLEEKRREASLQKFQQAKEVLRKESLSKEEVLVILSNDLRRLFTNDEFSELFTLEEKLALMDQGIVGDRVATEPREHYQYDENPDIPGFNHELDKSILYDSVSQDSIVTTVDIPVVSVGHGRCHGLLIGDRDTCATQVMHVLDYDLGDRQRRQLEKLLKTSGIREAILIHGSESRRYDRQRMYLEDQGISVREIIVSTGPYHWGFEYDPEANTVRVVRRMNKEVLVFDGFSEAVYDNDHRATYDIEHRRMDKAFEAIKQIYYINYRKYEEYNGTYSVLEFKSLIEDASRFLDYDVDVDELEDYLVAHQYAFRHGSDIIIPSGFSMEKTKQDETIEELERTLNMKLLAELDVHWSLESDVIYRSLLSSLSDYFVYANNHTARFQAKVSDESVIVHKAISLFKIVAQSRNDLTEKIVKTIEDIAEERDIPLFKNFNVEK